MPLKTYSVKVYRVKAQTDSSFSVFTQHSSSSRAWKFIKDRNLVQKFSVCCELRCGKLRPAQVVFD